ncbi:UDP-3-O-(3-hydroxymyristoyl)glucosamine N-acyltransferase [Xenorhabdus cabanillasii]|uniref:Transferase hexapeptide repeat n=1 Tax=Xenorhabdus cabanillasii JM26 TaxID=1427517 RepID=W1J3P1_9GAMM|nr:UDP-3-O-(3-hydroxymyristoyl)glucosamine N-acyltransferase [Xenorhabdus cabanillasii]PHM77696.1 UDP-3-O- glucosamine N-acyltransferase [Xenorhabdus cabanillasii JM26]CDL84451.1 Transferase hexapeptide repeat [Xenorhabdus cabanillasii JM26]
MCYQLKIGISIEKICKELNFHYLGNNSHITNVSQINNIIDGSLSFIKGKVDLLTPDVTLVCNESDIIFFNDKKTRFIISKNPRLDFIRILNFLDKECGFDHFSFKSKISPTASIGHNSIIEDGCIIYENVKIEHNVVIHSGTIIGAHSRIRANSSIGGDGFGFERKSDGVPIRFPHLGGVIIGENVEVGSNTCIARGTLSNTIIGDHVKIDNLVHIAHNCHIGKGTFITACAEISGGVTIGNNSWIGPNTSIIQKKNIGDNSLIGIGAVLTKDVPECTVFAGNPAKKIREI